MRETEECSIWLKTEDAITICYLTCTEGLQSIFEYRETNINKKYLFRAPEDIMKLTEIRNIFKATVF